MMKILGYLFMFNCLIFLFNFYYLYLYLGVLSFMLFFFILLFLNFNNYWMMIYGNLGFDKFSLMMIMLVIWIFSMVYFLSVNVYNYKFYFINMNILYIVLLLTFMWMNFFLFYFFFEISLIPIFFLIMGWGYQPERIKASVYMLFYTLFFSLPLLILLFILFNMNKSMYFLFYDLFYFFGYWILLIYLLMFMAFFVKLPLFLLHNWLPKAHVEAPLVGSVILAAVMLKLGGYGVIRMMLFLTNDYLNYNDFFMVIGMIGILILSVVCLRNYDMKIIVAYSSVVHMGMMLIGIFTMKFYGLLGGFIMMLGHGLCSSSLFIIVNYIYERSKSRNMLINKGMVYFVPSLMIFWFLFCMNNMASPISLNLLSEIMIIMVILCWSNKILLLMILGMFFSASYNLFLFSYTFHGIYNNYVKKIFSNTIMEFYILLAHFIPLNLLVIKLNFMI